MSNPTCKHCGSEAVNKYGTRNGVQRYWCKVCKRKFIDKDTLTKMRTPVNVIASAVGMYYGGMPLDSIQRQIEQDHDTRMSESGIYYWVVRFSKDAVLKAREFRPRVGNTWIADETVIKSGGKNIWFWDIIDADTRYLLATHISDTRTTKDAQTLMEKAAKAAGKIPKSVVTDRLKAYIDGIELTFGSETKHIQSKPFEEGNLNNLIERFHGTLKDRTKVVRGFQNMATARLLTDAWLIHYNFLKDHSALGDIPPAQKMGEVPFKNWVDIVRMARTAPEVTLESYTVSDRRTRPIRPRGKRTRITKRKPRITPPMPSLTQVRRIKLS